MPKRYYLIDGYNLMHVTEFARTSYGPGGLERARLGLILELAAHFDHEQSLRSTIVFDAKRDSIESDSATSVHGIKVLYAGGYEEADDLIEQIIREHSSPQQLIVVSSDHRLHQAARRRNAKPIDSDVFWNSRFNLQTSTSPPLEPDRNSPAAGLTPQEEELAERLQRELDEQNRRKK